MLKGEGRVRGRVSGGGVRLPEGGDGDGGKADCVTA